MKTKISLFIVLIVLPLLLCGQTEYEELLDKVESLGSEQSHRKFLTTLMERDQKYRGGDALIQHDYENIVLASHYVNTYGYPHEHLEDTPLGLSYVWIHCWQEEIKYLSFPIIWGAFSKGYISKDLLHSYYLRGLYKGGLLNKGYYNLTVEDIMKELRPNITDSIDIAAIHQSYNDYKILLENLSEPLGVWATDPKPKEYTMPDGGVLQKTEPADYIEIRQYGDVKYVRKYNKNWPEDTYRALNTEDQKLYRYVDKGPSVNYLEINDQNELMIKDMDGEVVLVYKPMK